MRKSFLLVLIACIFLCVPGCSGTGKEKLSDLQQGAKPTFRNASVHDPSVLKVGKTFYVIGSHMASAKSDDLMHWSQISTGPQKGNKLIPDPAAELSEALTWAQSDTFWAGDWIQLKSDGKYHMYYCSCKGDSPRACIGMAVSDQVEGPYQDKGIILKSGMWGEKSPDGKIYDATIHPNAVDPQVFYDKNGNLWMVYGSYSGGIFILKMDSKTGMPVPGQGYGKKLLGGNHSRIEGPYILYSPQTDYYYLFLSFGGLDSTGGYNIRVCRSKAPDGPYEDAAGNNMYFCRGSDGAISEYGLKIMGNYRWVRSQSDLLITVGYVSPGHNSAYYDSETGKYYLIFHTRFPGQGESHQIRVHQMFLNSAGWPVAAPFRYAAETAGSYRDSDIPGTYKYIGHGGDISAKIKPSVLIELKKDHTITGAVSGSWNLYDGHMARLVIDGEKYEGVFLWQWDEEAGAYTMTFSAASNQNHSIWGTKAIKK